MKYNFDKDTNRKSTNSFKWNCIPENSENELYPMWVADMEFEASEGIRNRLFRRVEEGVYGYELLSEKYYEAVRHWLFFRHQYKVEKESVVYCANTMVGLSTVVQTLTKPGDEVLTLTPAYGNFFHTIEGCGHRVIESELVLKDNRFTFCLEDMEKRVSSRTKVFLLCNPQNPTGTVWTKEELKRLCGFCQKHRLIILSDEIHYDLIFGAEHTMMARVSEASGIDTITLTAPGKTFNVAGIQSASMIINNMDIRQEVQRTMKSLSYPFEHAFAEAVTIGAYLESEEWLEEMLAYIGENRRIFQNFVKKYLPVLQMADSRATYLMWVDCSKMGLPPEELYAFWRNKCGVVINEGREFRGNADNFVRFNVACQRNRLIRVLEHIKEVFEREGY